MIFSFILKGKERSHAKKKKKRSHAMMQTILEGKTDHWIVLVDFHHFFSWFCPVY